MIHVQYHKRIGNAVQRIHAGARRITAKLPGTGHPAIFELLNIKVKS